MKAKTRLPLIDRIILWLNTLLWIALFTSYLAPYIDPRTAWVFAFFGLGYPFLLTAAIILLVYWLFRNWRYVLVSVAVILCGWNVLLNSFEVHAGRSDAERPGATVVRMMTYNVHDFKRYGSKNDISTKHEILDIINTEKPDIIGFQEFYTRTEGQYDMRDSIMKIMGSANYYFQPIIFNNYEAIGIAIFSKFPIVGQGFIPISEKRNVNACIYVDVQAGSRKFRVYSVHLRSIRFDPEDYKYINSITHDGSTDMSSARRLGSKLRTAFIKRSAQVDKIKQDADKCPYPYLISGDFNDTPSSYAVHEMSKGLKNAFREQGNGFGQTYNGNFPNYQIDYILGSPQFDVASYHIIEKRLSDHYPVRSDLILK